MSWISRSSVGLRAAFSRKSAKWEMWSIGLAGALILGAVLRLVWVMDMEYKGDEAWTFDRTQRVGRTEPFPWLGMDSSVKVSNPGMNVWVFLLLAKLFLARDPTTLARAVQLLNVSAIVLLVIFAFRMVLKEEREPWLWAAALVSVNPLAVLFHRKIWPPSVLPILTLLMLTGWWRRDRRWGAFTWGLVAVCLGQIHMPGFFLAGGFVIWAMLFDRERVAWKSWLIGSSLGALPLIPWLKYMFTRFGDRPSFTKWSRLFEFKLWTHWATEPLGIGLKYALGRNFSEFLAYPIISGRPTYLVGLLHLLLIVLGVVILARAGYLAWRDRQRWRDLLVGTESETAFTVNAALLGFGILLTASMLPFHRHYLIVTFPLMYVWLARLALVHSRDPSKTPTLGRAFLVALCISESLLSAGFLYYIHVNQGAPRGGYGVAYGAQERSKILSPGRR